MKNRLFNMIKRSIISKPSDDTGNYPVAQIFFNGKTGNSEIFWTYGIGGVAPKDSLCLSLNVMAQEENKVTFASLPSMRPKGLKEGEFYVSNLLTGSIILFKANGDIDITSKSDLNIDVSGNVNINVSGDVNVTASTANINANTNLGSGGPAIARTGDIVTESVFPFDPIGIIGVGSANHTAS